MSGRGQLLRAALVMAEVGWPVFPCRTDKSPDCRHGFKDASSNAEQVRALFEQASSAAHIGIPTGAVSGVIVIDVDVKNGQQGMKWLGENQYRLPATHTYPTQSGGRHLVYRRPAAFVLRSTQGKILPGVDVRADGGYVIYWPASADANTPANSGIFAEMPDWLLTACAATPSGPRLVAGTDIEEARDLSTLAPPTAAHAVRLLGRMNNPDNVGRDQYVATMFGAKGCIEGLRAAGRLQDNDEDDIKNAACSWAAKWAGGGNNFEGELHKWDTDFARQPPRVGWQKLQEFARELAPGYQAEEAGAFFEGVVATTTPGASFEAGLAFEHFDFGELGDTEPKPRQWIVDGWIPSGYVTLLHGNGGTNKSTLAMQLMTACASGRPWLGLETRRCPVIGIFGEDAKDELHRRQIDINVGMGVDFTDIRGRMSGLVPTGEDIVLMTFDRNGKGTKTAFYHSTLKKAEEAQARLVVIDNIAATFGGNQNDAYQVRQFMRALEAMASKIDGAVLLIGHSSRGGMRDTGDGSSGSVDWRNACRSGLTLKLPKPDQKYGKADLRTSERILTRAKANMASQGEVLRLQWDKNFLRPQWASGWPMMPGSERLASEDAFLRLLDNFQETRRHVSHVKTAINYAPKVFAREKLSYGYSKSDFETVMRDLFAAHRIVIAEYGRSGKRHDEITRAPVELHQ